MFISFSDLSTLTTPRVGASNCSIAPQMEHSFSFLKFYIDVQTCIDTLMGDVEELI